MLTIRTKEIALFKTVFSGISDMIPEAKLIFEEENIVMRSMATGNYAAVFLSLSKNLFVEYTAITGDSIVVQTVDFAKIVRLAKDGDVLELVVDGEGIFYVRIIGSRTKEYTLPLLKEQEEKHIPEEGKVTFPFKTRIDVEEFSSSLDSVQAVAKENSTQIYIRNNRLFVGMKEINRSAKVDFMDVKEASDMSSKFNGKWIQDFIKAGRGIEQCTLCLGNDHPLGLDFVTPDKLKLSFLLAPRVDNF
jgi:DNA polymerase III sliding clamp (beta) subunit (PCNA family)